MKGHLHLTCARLANGESALREQSFCAPFHLSKPHQDCGALVVNVVNPTAGLFDGDELDLLAQVECGARLVLTTPSAGRVYQSRSGTPARLQQRVQAAAGSFVEFLPEPLIPQAGAVYAQQTTLDVAAEAELLFFEWLSPGRVASGEVFQYRQLAWQTDLRVDGRLVARERYRVEPEQPATLAALTDCFPQAHYLGCFWVSARPFPEAAVAALQGPGIYLGWSQLAAGGWSLKALCADALTTRRLLGGLRAALYAALERHPPWLGRF